MKFGQLIEYNKRNIFFEHHVENQTGRLVPGRFLIFKKTLYKIKESGLDPGFTASRQPSNQHTIKTNCIKLQTINPEIYSILIFQKTFWEQFLHHIQRIIFQQKCFLCYILSTDQISLSDCLYVLRYWTIYVLQLFVNQDVTS